MFKLKKNCHGAYGRNFGSKGKIQNVEDVCDTLQAAMGNGGGNVPILKQVGILDIKGIDQIKRVYSDEGISPTLSTMQGGNTEPKIIKYDVPQTVKVRKFPIDIEKLKEVLRNAKIETDITNSTIAFKLDVPITKVEHWFRKDNCFAIPDENIWFNLKELLNIKTNEFDKSIITFEEKDGIYDKANRVYDEQGIAPTLTQQEEKIVENKYKIRKLTPKECWRLMGFSDVDFEKAVNIPTSNTQLYKQARQLNLCTSFRKNIY